MFLDPINYHQYIKIQIICRQTKYIEIQISCLNIYSSLYSKGKRYISQGTCKELSSFYHFNLKII